jgi:lysyl-tRNA synthetase class 2
MTTMTKNQPKRPLFLLQQAIRNHFNSEGFMDVLTPPAVDNPGMEVHIHPFQLYSVHKQKCDLLYLHTSPEFQMKKLLSEGMEKIFTMSYCFRDEPISETHRPQFIMLEWYRAHQRYEKIMDDCEALIKSCHDFLKSNGVTLKESDIKFTKRTVQEIFLETINIDILEYHDKDKLYQLLANDFRDVPLPSSKDDLSWDDLFFLLMLNKVEPQFKKYPFLLIYEFPAPLKALSTIKKDDNRVCERFEIYANGLELCNCFNELTDLEEQKTRFEQQAKEKKDLYGYQLPEARTLYQALESKIPPSAGIALGVERLLAALTGEVDSFYFN